MTTISTKEKLKQARMLLFANLSSSVFFFSAFLKSLKQPEVWQSIAFGMAMFAVWIISLLLFIRVRKLNHQQQAQDA
ncbi:hypothetical protein [Mucilaginibacter koreensis]